MGNKKKNYAQPAHNYVRHCAHNITISWKLSTTTSTAAAAAATTTTTTTTVTKFVLQIKNSSKHNQFLLFVDVSVSIRFLHHQKKLVLFLPVLDMTKTWMKAAINSVTHTSAFLARQVQVQVLVCQEPEELVWWRSLIETEKSTKTNNWLYFDEIVILIWNVYQPNESVYWY